MVKPVKKGFTITLLGTDTKYLPKNLENAYDEAETFSHVSTAVQHENSSYETNNVVQYRNENVAVIDGPTTLGEEVGDRIARAVAAILEAISRGETQINIMAHSRGAVEAILVAHELERLQKLYAKGETPDSNEPYRGEKDIPCNYTNEAMKKLKIFDLEEGQHDAIRKTFKSVKVSMLCVDPVPGGSWFGSKYFSTIPWIDPRFYELPAIVSDYEQILYENERTRCFIPIIPAATSPHTIFKLTSMPGHHGTGSGNYLSQTRQPVPKGKTKHVQQLMVLKSIEFLRNRGVTLEKRQYDPFPRISALFDIKDETQFKKRLNKLKLDLYDKIVKHKEAYQFFNTTSYSTLGKESINGQRIIHKHSRKDYSPLSIHVPRVYGEDFINSEHALLRVKSVLGIEDKESIDELINYATSNLLGICKASVISNINIAKSASDFASSEKNGPTEETMKLMGSKEGRDLFLKNVHLLINEVVQPYLQGHFSNNSEEREKVYAALYLAFKKLNKHLDKNPKDKFAGDILKVWNLRLDQTLQTKVENFQKQYTALSHKLAGRDFLYHLEDAFKEYIRSIQNEDHLQSDDNKISVTVQQFFIELHEISKKQTPLDLNELRGILDRQLKLLLREDYYPDTPVTNSYRNALGDLIKDAIQNSYSYDPENIALEAKEIQKEIRSFQNALERDFRSLNQSIETSSWQRELNDLQLKTGLIQDFMHKQKVIERLEKESSIINHLEANILQQKETLGRAETESEQQKTKIDSLEQEIVQLNQSIQRKDLEIYGLKNPPPLPPQEEMENEDNLSDHHEAISEVVIPEVVLPDYAHEDKCTALISNTLEPITKEYLLHLMKSAKFGNKNQSVSHRAEMIVDSDHIVGVDPLLESKLKDVAQLYLALHCNKKASTRVNQYFEQLELFEKKGKEENISTLRHERKKFIADVCKGTAIALGVLLTGIIPGVALLGLAKYFGKGPSFGASKGSLFFKEVNKYKKEMEPGDRPQSDENTILDK